MTMKLGLVLATFLVLGDYITEITSSKYHHRVYGFGVFPPFGNPIPLHTPGPINVDTSKVENITTSPVVFLIDEKEKGIMRNTGRSVEVYLDGYSTANGIVAGVLELSKTYYVFRKFRFYWAARPNESAATTVDGQKEYPTPLEVSIYYYNLIYGSFEKALNFKNGIAEVIFRLTAGSTPNPKYDKLASHIRRVQKAGSEVQLNITDDFSFYYKFSKESKYFAYPSSYTDETTGKQYSCVTTILTTLDPTQHFISKEQFEDSFLTLTNYKGKPLINTAKRAPRGYRTVVESKGLIKHFHYQKFPSIP